ncbi:NUMOD4 domain-containing protein [Flavobacterium sp. SM15]|uniref:NUMOD4 domain-containing protein n=1 Tax=Flavobacterium sp. SM15 TaxID=2908005 RepID=UPI001EDAE550|nr:NUMOD4 domain-containing protein [Flavobacterium sp. SM15]MCG2611498.1 NUMOD4 domain-containing protein [Flavobacterium sp. SM15]
MKEIWLPINGYEGLYEISNLGNVKSIRFNKEKILKANDDSRGYLYVGLHNNGVSKYVKIHKLVFNTFNNILESPKGFVVDHINSDKSDNTLINLRLISIRDNISKERINNTGYKGVVKKGSRFAAKIGIGKKTIHLGTFDTPQEANKVYLEKIKLLMN